MKNRGIVFVLLLLAGAPFIEQVGGQCLGLDLSSVSFINLSDSRQPGLYARMGVTFNLSTETELKLAMISRLTPILIPYSCVSVGIGRNLLGSRKMKYFNTLIMSGM
nr:hypothetical protein [Spirochaeta sp.]